MAKRKNNRNKAIVAVIILVIALFTAIIVYNNRSYLQQPTTDQGQTVHTFESGKGSQFAAVKDKVVVVDTDGITFAQRGKDSAPLVLAQMSAPQLLTNERYTMVYDRGGTVAQAFDGEQLCASITADHPILKAKINSNGYMVLITNDTGYKAKITVYNNKGKGIYQWRLGEEHVLDADVSPNGKYLAASTLSTSGASAQSTVRLVSISDEAVLGETSRSNSLIFNLKFINNRTVAALGDDALLALNRKGELLWERGFEGRVIQNAILQENNNMVLAFAGTSNNSDIEIYDTKGRVKGSYTSASEVKSISMYKGDIAVAQAHQVDVVNHNGKVTATAMREKDVKQVMMLPSDRVAVSGAGTVDIIKP